MSETTCTHCHDSIRREGLQLISNSDELTACPDAPLITCERCEGNGCDVCEHYGQRYGNHAVRDIPAADAVRYTSWGQENDMEWNTFRQAVIGGTDANEAATRAGLTEL